MSQEVIRDFRRYGPSYLLTTVTTIAGDRAEPISSTLLLAVPYLVLAQGPLLHLVSYLSPVVKIARRTVTKG